MRRPLTPARPPLPNRRFSITLCRSSPADGDTARFSGVSTGACIGHVSPEALSGGPIGKLRDGDLVEIVIDRATLHGTVNFVGEGGVNVGAEAGAGILQRRKSRPDLAPDPGLPDDTRLWAALQDVSGGAWGGSVFDVDQILKVIAAGKQALQS